MMIRLAVSSVEEARWREVAPRLRGTTIALSMDFRFPVSPEGCDAAAFIGPGCPESGVIEHLLCAGKHVLLAVESGPLSDVFETWHGAARQANVRLAVVNPDRYLPSRQLIRQQLDAGKLGEAVLVRVHRWEPVAPNDTRTWPRVPGPVVRDLELTLGLLGKPPNLVYAVEQFANERATSSGRFVQIHLGFPGGGMALIDYADRLPPGDAYQSLSVIGSAGAAYADDHQNMQLVYRGSHPQAVRTDEGARQFAALVQEFVDALHAGGDTPGDVTAWRTVWAVADAVRRSLEARQAISLEGN